MAQTLEDANEALARGDWALAEEWFRSLLLERPDSIPAQVGWALALGEQERGSQAIGSLRNRLERARREGDLDGAAEVARALTKLVPDDARSFLELGRLLAEQRQWVTAEAAARRAVELSPEDPASLSLLGLAQWENGDDADSVATLEKARLLAPDSVDLALQLAGVLRWRGDYARALERLDEVTSAGATDSGRALVWHRERALVLEGLAEQEPEMVEEALEAMRRLAELTPDDSKVRYSLALLLRRTGDERAAREQMEEFRRLYQLDQKRTRDEGRTKKPSGP